jgi:hypothetical protein
MINQAPKLGLSRKGFYLSGSVAGGGSLPAFIQRNAGGNTSGNTTMNITTGTTTGAGRTLTLGLAWANRSATILSIAGGGLTWTIPSGGQNGDSALQTAIAFAYAPSGLASGVTITITFSDATFGGCAYDLVEFSGVSSSTTADGAASLTGAGFGTAFSNSVNSSQANNLALAMVAGADTQTLSGYGYTLELGQTQNSKNCYFMYLVVGGGPTNPGGIWSGAINLYGTTVVLNHQ